MKGLYFLACGLLAISIIMESFAKHYFSTASVTVARAIALSSSERSEAHNESDALGKTGRRFSLAGITLAIVGLCLWVFSLRGEKRMTPVLPISLLAAYVLLLFLMV